MFFNIFKKKRDLFEGSKRVLQGSLKLNFNFKKYAEKNIFNQLSKKSEYGYYYWPYGYMFRYPKWNDINELGFRNNFEFFEVKDKFKEHYKIGLFGGSTGFDICVEKKNSICGKLENKLNNCQDLKKIGKFKIINFSQPGAVLLNQIINFIQFGDLCDLKMIISHNPANEYVGGLIGDPKLLTNYKITYNDIIPVFARKIHDADDVDLDCLHMDPREKNFKPAEPKTNPENTIEAYIFRVKQFEKIAKGMGIVFLSGYQPWISSKKDLSDYEKNQKKTYNRYYKKIYNLTEEIYKIFDQKYLYLLEKENFINFDKIFENADSKINHFNDTHHMLEPGNEIISDVYYQNIKKILLKTYNKAF